MLILSINHIGILTWVFWSNKGLFRNVTKNIWNDCFHSHGWIFRIVVVAWSRCIFDWCTILIYWNNLTKFCVSNCIFHFWKVWSNFKSTSLTFICIEAFNYWNFYNIISEAVLIPSACLFHLVKLTVEAEAILNVDNWIFVACTLEGNRLFRILRDIIQDWFVNQGLVHAEVNWQYQFTFSLVASNLWCWCFNNLRSILRIISIMNWLCIRYWITKGINRDNLTEFFIDNTVCGFWFIRCNNLHTSHSLVRIVTFDNWDINLSIGMAVLIPSVSVFCLVVFTSEGKVRLNINRRCCFSSTFEEDSLQGWLRYIFKDWSVLNKNIVCQALRHDTLLHWTVTRNVRNKCLTNLSWVIGIVVEGWRWNVWNQASIRINRNNLTKWNVGNGFFDVIFSNLSTFNFYSICKIA